MNKIWYFQTTLLFSCVMGAVSTLTGQVKQDQNWEQITLNIKADQRLVNLFDDGFRPYWYPYLESSLLEQKYLLLQARLPSDKLLSAFPAETTAITVDKPGIVRELESTSSWMSEEEALKLVSLILKSAGREDRIAEFEQFISTLSSIKGLAEFIDRYPSSFSIYLVNEDKYKVIIAFPCDPRRKEIGEDPVKIQLIINWYPYKKSVERKSYSEPIPPPPGYEEISMKTPKDFGPGNNFKERITENTSSNIGDKGLKNEKPEPKHQPKPIPEERDSSASEPNLMSENKSNHLPLIFLGLILIGVITCIIKMCKNK